MIDIYVFMMFAFLALVGAVAGVIAGLLGVGGGIVLVPAFFTLFSYMGYDGPDLMQVCLATSLATIIVTSARSVMAHHRKGAVLWGVLQTWAPYIGLGAVLGVLIATRLHSDVLRGIFGVLGVCIGLYMAFGRLEWRLGEEMPHGPGRAMVGTGIGFLSVLMGIGGGSFAVPLMLLHNIAIHRAVATAAGFGMMIALPSAVVFCFVAVENAPPFTLGAVNIPAFILVVAMTLMTAPLGVRLAHATDPKPLKRIFAIFIILMALNMLRKVMGY